MKSLSSHIFCAAAMALALPVLGMCDAVSINGTCVSGNCASPDSVGYPGSSSGSTSTNITVNGDPFSVVTSYTATFNGSGTYVLADPTVTYTGSAPLTHTDAVTINVYQDFYYPGSGITWNGAYNEQFPFSIPTDATASGELFIDGQGIGFLGPYGPGTYNEYGSATLSGLNGNYLTYDFQFNFDFDPGAAPGSIISSSPEPAQTIPVASAIVGCGLFALYRRRKQAANLR